jgi:hypothetical protein
MAADPADEKATPATRTPRAVINEAIRETAPYETICWWGLVIFGLTGVNTILAAVWQGSAGMGAVGAVPTALCWPAIRYAIAIRKGNVALRLLELALNNVNSSELALDAINRAFGAHFGEGEGKARVVPKPTTKVPRRPLR